ncbi:MAG: serine/threonine protein phosphatase [Alphaproteobacteria bacterium]|nr:serine/threonine protein phosphatase [Alphaproteobacteria bacterium]
MIQFFRQFLAKNRSDIQNFTAKALPERPLYAIGDIHGRNDLLGPLLTKIETHANGTPYDLVTVGDYVDRGEDASGVLSCLQSLSDLPHVTCLMGNHERMLLDFIDDPAKNGRRWFRNGGLQTLASFGVGGLTENARPEAMALGKDQLLEALGDLEPWLRARPLCFQSGNIAVVHAGAKPNLPIAEQPDKTLLWGHPAFFREVRGDGIWVIHGHTIVETARAEAGRISIDTGAYATGKLTAVVCDGGHMGFL